MEQSGTDGQAPQIAKGDFIQVSLALFWLEASILVTGYITFSFDNPFFDVAGLLAEVHAYPDDCLAFDCERQGIVL